MLLLPYHQPVILAKRLATLDVLSKGRMRLLTVGVGALPGEAMAAGVYFATRGRRADEAIDVLRLLWSGDEDGVSFDGEFFSFTRLCSFPKPLASAARPHRRIQPGRGPPRGPARRRLLPGRPAHRAGASQPARGDAGHRARRGPGPRRAGVHPVGIDRHDRRRRGRPRRARDARLVVPPASAGEAGHGQISAFADPLGR